jgi:hypothetical protein
MVSVTSAIETVAASITSVDEGTEFVAELSWNTRKLEGRIILSSIFAFLNISLDRFCTCPIAFV